MPTSRGLRTPRCSASTSNGPASQTTGHGLSPRRVRQNAAEASAPVRGWIPAYYDASLGGIAKPGGVVAALLRFLVDGGVPSGTDASTMSELFHAHRIASAAPGDIQSASEIAVCIQRAAKQRTLPPELRRRTGRIVMPHLIPPVAVRVVHDEDSARRWTVWLALRTFVAHQAGERSTAEVSVADVYADVCGAGVPGAWAGHRLRTGVGNAMRMLARYAPTLWSARHAASSGTLRLQLRADAASWLGAEARAALWSIDDLVPASLGHGPRNDRLEQATEAVLAAMRPLILTADPPVCRVADIPIALLSATLGRPMSRRAVTIAVGSLSRVRRHQPLVNAGVFARHRYFTLPEQAECARAAVALLRAPTALQRIEQELRALTRCPVAAVRAERLGRVQVDLTQCASVRTVATPFSGQSPWIAKQLSTLERRAARVRAACRRCATSVEEAVADQSASVRMAQADRVEATYAGHSLLAETEHLTRRWESTRQPAVVAAYVRRLCERWESDNSDGETPVGLRGRYPAFAVRALILERVGDPPTQYLARQTSRWLGTSPSESALLQGIAESSVAARLASCAGLALIGGSRAVTSLLWAACHDAEHGVRESAMWALSLLSPPRAVELDKNGSCDLSNEGRRRVGLWLRFARSNGQVPWASPSFAEATPSS